MRDSGNKAYILEQILSLNKGLLEIIRGSFAEDSKLILCFICSLGTAIGLVLSATCLIGENASLGLLCIGFIISAISFAAFLYIVLKMD
jgi:hypothetical protein